jgi:hypothetical protein
MTLEVHRFPNGLFRLGDDGVVEITGSEPVRVPAADVKAIEIGQPKRGKLAVKFRYVTGLDNNTNKFLVDEDQLPAVEQLLAAVQAAGGAQR